MATADGRKIGPRPATTDRLRKKLPMRVEHEVVLDNQLAEALNRAKLEMELAESKWKGLAASIDAKTGDAKTRQAQQAEEARADYEAKVEAYEEAREEAAEHTMVLVFRGIGRHKLDVLQRLHRPTEEDIDEAKAQGMTEAEIKTMDVSPRSHPPALIAASLEEPKLTEDEVRELIWDSDTFNQAEAYSVLMAATRANGTVARVDLGPTFGASPSAKKSNGSQAESGDPAASSSGGSGPTQPTLSSPSGSLKT